MRWIVYFLWDLSYLEQQLDLSSALDGVSRMKWLMLTFDIVEELMKILCESVLWSVIALEFQ